eukprot:534488_1
MSSLSKLAGKLLLNQHIAITGGAGALAIPTIKAFVEHGANVSVADIVDETTFMNSLEKSENVYYNQCDTSKESEVEQFIKNASKQFGTINTSCIHAGIVTVNPILQESVSNFSNIINTNLIGSFIFSQKCAQHMIENQTKGHLIFTSSWVAENNWPGLIGYGAAKAGMNSLMKSYALELTQFGIRSNAISPGIVDAGMARVYYESDPAYRGCVDSTIPMKKLQPLQSVVDIFVFLCSDASDYLNGSVVNLDGGAGLINKHTVPIYYDTLKKHS